MSALAADASQIRIMRQADIEAVSAIEHALWDIAPIFCSGAQDAATYVEAMLTQLHRRLLEQYPGSPDYPLPTWPRTGTEAPKTKRKAA